MKIKAIITTLVLGSSSVALADPIYRDGREPAPLAGDYDDGDYDNNRYDNNRYDDGYGNNGYDNDDRPGAHGDFRQRFRRPLLLASDVQLNSWDHRPTFVPIDSRVRGVRTLRFQREVGRTFIASVAVMFADGHHQMIRVNQLLSRRSPAFTIALPHGGITGVYIYGRGQMVRGTFDVIGLHR